MMDANDKLLLELITPALRKVLIQERLRAMKGEISDATRELDRLQEITTGADRVSDRIALAMLRAELSYLNFQSFEAIEYFKSNVVPFQSTLSPSCQFVVQQNLATLEFANWSKEAHATFYDLIDRRRAAGFVWFDAQEVLMAQEAADEGKHYDALPIYWRQLVRSYMQFGWMPAQQASRRMAIECLKLGFVLSAVFHSIISTERSLLPSIVATIYRARDANIAQSVVSQIIAAANLGRHFVVACDLLREIADVIPDAQIDKLAEWLLLRCKCDSDEMSGNNVSHAAWSAFETIAHRTSPSVAERAIEEAVKHPRWTAVPESSNRVIVHRDQIVKTVNCLIGVIDASVLHGVAKAAVPLATQRRQSHDYSDVVNLLCHIAERGDSSDVCASVRNRATEEAPILTD
jgi:hypothetical protein